MHLRPVQSSRIQAIGYDEDTWTCYVQFQPTAREPKGTIYAYANVPPAVFERFSAAPSKGRFFGEHLADREQHPKLRLGEPHTPARRAPKDPSSTGLLMFRPKEGKAADRRQADTAAKPKTRSEKRSDVQHASELTKLARERELLREFFRPMRESALAAYRAVLEKEEEALAQFRAAEAALSGPLPGVSRRASGDRGSR